MATPVQLKHVLRRLGRSPVFAGVTLLTLAIGIGANAAIFGVVEGVLLKPLPFPRPDELVGVWYTAPGLNLPEVNAAPSLYFTHREEGRAFEDIGMWAWRSATVTGLGEPERLTAIRVTDGLLGLLGVPPALGRPFTAKDDQAGSPPTVILTYGYWQSRFGGDPAAVGRRLMVDGEAHEVIGVMPRQFRFLDTKTSLLLPLQLDRSKVFLGNFSYMTVARLKPGVTLEAANADVARMLPIAFDRFPAPPGFNKQMFTEARLGPNVRPFKRDLVGDVGKVLWVLMGTIGMVLFIACANVANLLLVRAEGRQQELAVRAALGAGRGQIAGELLLESLVLGLLGGALGLGVAYGLLRLLAFLAPANLPRLDEIGIDLPVVLFTAAVSVLAGALLGLIPVFKYAGPRLAAALHSSSRSASESRERHRTRNTLVVVQVGLALVLLVGSGLMIRSFRALREVEPGFTRPQELQTIRVVIPEGQVKDEESVMRMQQAIQEKIAALPGVVSAGLANAIPLDYEGWRDPVFAEDRTYAEGDLPALRLFKFLAPGFLDTMGTPLVAGREFGWTDLYDRTPVVMISASLAREMWGDPQAALGKRLRENSNGAWREVIGVVADVYNDGLDQQAPATVYWPILMKDFQASGLSRSLVHAIRSPRAGSEGFLKEIREAVWSVNSNLPVASPQTMQFVYERALARTSFTMALLALAGAMALLIGVVGIYGVISYAVSQRTREIGIRMALGARREELTAMFVRHGLLLASIGAACGLVAAFALSRLISSLLFGVGATDPLTYAAVAVLLVAAAVVASYLPARRASAVDPMDALRAE